MTNDFEDFFVFIGQPYTDCCDGSIVFAMIDIIMGKYDKDRRLYLNKRVSTLRAEV